MGRGTHCGISCFWWLWLATTAIQHAWAATVLWTAYVEISYRNSSDNQTVRQICECGLYGLNSPLDVVAGQVELPASDPLACGPFTRFNSSAKAWIALIERGNCTFTEKIKAATENGAVAVVIYNLAGTGNEKSPMVHHGKDVCFCCVFQSCIQMPRYFNVTKLLAAKFCLQVQHTYFVDHVIMFCMKSENREVYLYTCAVVLNSLQQTNKIIS